MLLTRITRILLISITVGVYVYSYKAYADSVQTRLRITVTVTGQCSFRPPSIDKREHLNGPPAFVCSHALPIGYHWDDLPDKLILIDALGAGLIYSSAGKPRLYNSQDFQMMVGGHQQTGNHNHHVLTILY